MHALNWTAQQQVSMLFSHFQWSGTVAQCIAGYDKNGLLDSQKSDHLPPSHNKKQYTMQSSFRSNRMEGTRAALLPSPAWSWGDLCLWWSWSHLWTLPRLSSDSWLIKSSQNSLIYLLKWTKLCQMADVFIKMSSSAQHQGCGQLSCVLSSPAGSLLEHQQPKRGQGQNRALAFSLSSKHWDGLIALALCTEADVHHNEPGKFRYSMTPIGTNLGVRLYTDFGTELISTTLLKPAKLSLSVFSSFE